MGSPQNLYGLYKKKPLISRKNTVLTIGQCDNNSLTHIHFVMLRNLSKKLSMK